MTYDFVFHRLHHCLAAFRSILSYLESLFMAPNPEQREFAINTLGEARVFLFCCVFVLGCFVCLQKLAPFPFFFFSLPLLSSSQRVLRKRVFEACREISGALQRDQREPAVSYRPSATCAHDSQNPGAVFKVSHSHVRGQKDNSAGQEERFVACVFVCVCVCIVACDLCVL